MSLKVLFVTSTSAEAQALIKTIGIVQVHNRYCYGSLEIELLTGGIGTMSTAWAMTQWISVNGKPDLAINAGIAGSYNEQFRTGCVVMPVSDCFADAGIEDGEKFVTLYEAGLTGMNDFPFRNGFIYSDNRYCEELKKIIPPVKAVTVNTATGSELTRQRLTDKYDPGIETMEGAAFFFICAMNSLPFIAVRAVSNMVELRDRTKWNIPLAIENLALKFEEVFSIIDT